MFKNVKMSINSDTSEKLRWRSSWCETLEKNVTQNDNQQGSLDKRTKIIEIKFINK